ncbi:MAG: hypothetical protein LBK26_04285 [Rickettsiales bacterium]|nr:hypothetical protein [Rickettsiales bacterium]
MKKILIFSTLCMTLAFGARADDCIMDQFLGTKISCNDSCAGDWEMKWGAVSFGQCPYGQMRECYEQRLLIGVNDKWTACKNRGSSGRSFVCPNAPDELPLYATTKGVANMLDKAHPTTWWDGTVSYNRTYLALTKANNNNWCWTFECPSDKPWHLWLDGRNECVAACGDAGAYAPYGEHTCGHCRQNSDYRLADGKCIRRQNYDYKGCYQRVNAVLKSVSLGEDVNGFCIPSEIDPKMSRYAIMVGGQLWQIPLSIEKENDMLMALGWTDYKKDAPWCWAEEKMKEPKKNGFKKIPRCKKSTSSAASAAMVAGNCITDPFSQKNICCNNDTLYSTSFYGCEYPNLTWCGQDGKWSDCGIATVGIIGTDGKDIAGICTIDNLNTDLYEYEKHQNGKASFSFKNNKLMHNVCWDSVQPKAESNMYRRSGTLSDGTDCEAKWANKDKTKCVDRCEDSIIYASDIDSEQKFVWVAKDDCAGFYCADEAGNPDPNLVWDYFVEKHNNKIKCTSKDRTDNSQQSGESTKKEQEQRETEETRLANERESARLDREREQKLAAIETMITSHTKTMSDIKSAHAGDKVSAWKTADGNFNGARLASDSIAGAAIGTLGGVITFNIIKKNQINNGFDDLDCVVGGAGTANVGAPLQITISWGDVFMISGPTTKKDCEAASNGRNNIFVWAAKTGTGADYATLREDMKDTANNACWVRVDIISKDPNINTDLMKPRWFMTGARETCGGWLDENFVRQKILDAKKTKRTWGTVAGAVGGAAVGVGTMELFGNKLIGGKVMGQKALKEEELLRSQILAGPGGAAEWTRYESAKAGLAAACNELRAAGGKLPKECE